MRFQALQISEEVLDVLGRNLVVVQRATRSAPDKPWIWYNFKSPASLLLDKLEPKIGPGRRYFSKRRNMDFTFVEGTSSKWVLYVGDPETSREHYLLSEGNPDIEICDWNTIVDITVEDKIATIVNKSTINGASALSSKFNITKSAMAYIWGYDGEMTGIDFIGNVDDGNTSVNWNTGSSRAEYLKIMFPEPGEIAVPPILDIDDPITADGVDVVFEDTDPQEEYLVFQNIIGAKNVSDYWDIPKISIPMSKILSL